MPPIALCSLHCFSIDSTDMQWRQSGLKSRVNTWQWHGQVRPSPTLHPKIWGHDPQNWRLCRYDSLSLHKRMFVYLSSTLFFFFVQGGSTAEQQPAVTCAVIIISQWTCWWLGLVSLETDWSYICKLLLEPVTLSDSETDDSSWKWHVPAASHCFKSFDFHVTFHRPSCHV